MPAPEHPTPPQYPPPPIEAIDYKYVSRYATESFGITIYKNGVIADPDANAVTITMLDDAGATVTTTTATRLDVGSFQVTLPSVSMQTPGYYSLLWAYALDGVPAQYLMYFEVGQSAPEYDFLDAGMKDVIERVWKKFADLFDSVEGGPNLLDYYQSKFGRNRLATLLVTAINGINMGMQPMQNYTIANPGRFPNESWPGLLDQALYIEVIRHLRRSYVEQTDVQGVSHARFDRRDYMQRWGEILEEEKVNFRLALEIFKFDGMGRPVVLLSGGAYGNFGVERLPLSAAARPNFWSRVYN